MRLLGHHVAGGPNNLLNLFLSVQRDVNCPPTTVDEMPRSRLPPTLRRLCLEAVSENLEEICYGKRGEKEIEEIAETGKFKVRAAANIIRK